MNNNRPFGIAWLETNISFYLVCKILCRKTFHITFSSIDENSKRGTRITYNSRDGTLFY